MCRTPLANSAKEEFDRFIENNFPEKDNVIIN